MRSRKPFKLWKKSFFINQIGKANSNLRSELKEKYDEKVAKAKENTNGRIFEYK